MELSAFKKLVKCYTFSAYTQIRQFNFFSPETVKYIIVTLLSVVSRVYYWQIYHHVIVFQSDKDTSMSLIMFT